VEGKEPLKEARLAEKGEDLKKEEGEAQVKESG